MMNGDNGTPRRRKHGPLLWAGGAGVAAGLTGIIVHIVLHAGLHHAGQELDRQAVEEHLRKQMEIYSTERVAELLKRGGPEADAELARWAEGSPYRVWMPERRLVFSEENYAMPGSPEVVRGLPERGIPGMLKLVSPQDSPVRLFIHYGAEIRRIGWTGEVFEIDFKIQPGPAGRLGVSDRTTWTARFSLDEVVGLIHAKTSGQAMAAIAFGKPGDSEPTAYLSDWLRRAGALPPADAAGSGQAVNSE
jgi:hypothetical protein